VSGPPTTRLDAALRRLEAALRGEGAPLVLDGALATWLEAKGVDVSGPLWSARVLLEQPRALVDAAEDYARAGADVLTTATYQANIPGLRAAGLDDAAIRALFVTAAALVREGAARAGRADVCVAASQGPYGAQRADGSEYHGRYGVSRATLEDDHAARLDLARAGDVDVVAFETVPSILEVDAIVRVLERAGHPPAWLSLSVAPDGRHIADGTPLDAVAAHVPDTLALGVNCCGPAVAEAALGALAGRARVAYPNRGERWDAVGRVWLDAAPPPAFDAVARALLDGGAWLIGGCCRTTPDDVRAIARLVHGAR
jgi:homocysteine S-methyltransferase